MKTRPGGRGSLDPDDLGLYEERVTTIGTGVWKHRGTDQANQRFHWQYLKQNKTIIRDDISLWIVNIEFIARTSTDH